MNIEALTGSVSGWQRRNASPDSISQDTLDAISASGYGQIASLIVPNDYQMTECGMPEIGLPNTAFQQVNDAEIGKAAAFLRKSKKNAIIAGGRALRKKGLAALARIQASTGCDLITGSFPPYMERGAGYPNVIRLPYFPEPAIDVLSGYNAFLLAGTREPVTFFGYPGIDSFLIRKDQTKMNIGTNEQYLPDVLEELAEALQSPAAGQIPNGILSQSSRPSVPKGQLTRENICTTIAALIPEDSIIVDEGLTTSIPFYPMTKGLPPHSYTTIAGGSIGYGMPCATGAAFACPGRPVINIQADGSAAYTMQALWTQAREKLKVITLICSNKGYNIIRVELARAGIASAGPSTLRAIDIEDPAINWVKIAEGMGVQAGAVSTAEELAFLFERALKEPGPYLIEMAVKYL
jgi:acetolactate synthase-1/2/3 large subunit